MLITVDELIARVENEGISLGKNPKRTLTYWRSLGLLAKPILVRKGGKTGTISLYDDESTISAIKKIREYQKFMLTADTRVIIEGIQDGLAKGTNKRKISKTERPQDVYTKLKAVVQQNRNSVDKLQDIMARMDEAISQGDKKALTTLLVQVGNILGQLAYAQFEVAGWITGWTVGIEEVKRVRSGHTERKPSQE